MFYYINPPVNPTRQHDGADVFSVGYSGPKWFQVAPIPESLVRAYLRNTPLSQYPNKHLTIYSTYVDNNEAYAFYRDGDRAMWFIIRCADYEEYIEHRRKLAPTQVPDAFMKRGGKMAHGGSDEPVS